MLNEAEITDVTVCRVSNNIEFYIFLIFPDILDKT